MIKYTSWDLVDKDGSYFQPIDVNHGLVKTAEYTTELKRFVDTLKPKPGKTYVLVNAMGASEFYGQNRNGDIFYEDSLKQYYKTFEEYGHAFKHHKNSDPTASYGKVVFATYNENMHRVELVIELDNDRAADILYRIDNGDYPKVSMGVKTPKDVCSICGNVAGRRADYCDHLKYEMGRIYSDGRQVGAINKYPLKFFDISFVMIPADAIAGTMAKLANYGAKIPSVVVAEELLKNSGIKESQLIKEIEGDIQAVNDDPKRLIYDSQPDLPNDELAQILSKYSLRDILSTLLGLRIVPKPEEFQRIVLIKANRPDIAEICDRNKVLLMHPDEEPRISPDISLDYFNDELARAIAHWVPERALTKPAIIKRVLLKRAALDSAPLPVGVQNILDNVRKIKQRKPKGPVLKEPRQSLYKPTKNPAVPLLGMGSLYLGYHKLMDALHKTAPGLISARNLGGLEKHLLKKPWLLPLLLGGVAAGTVGLQEHLFKEAAMVNPTFLKSMMVSVPASYIYGGYSEHKLRQGQPITKFQDFVRRHPFLTGMAGTVGLRRLARGIVKTSALDSLDDIIYGLDPVKLDEFYADVIDAR